MDPIFNLSLQNHLTFAADLCVYDLSADVPIKDEFEETHDEFEAEAPS